MKFGDIRYNFFCNLMGIDGSDKTIYLSKIDKIDSDIKNIVKTIGLSKIDKMDSDIKNIAKTIDLSKINKIDSDIKDIMIKLSYKDDIYFIQGAIFYLPNYPIDYIQRIIIRSGKFYEQTLLDNLKFDDYDIIFDCGANIGNHSIYWALKRNAKEIHSFEPVNTTYNILKKNIELNKLENIIHINNVGLSAKTQNSSILNGTKNIDNIGGTNLIPDENGDLKLLSMDDYIKNNFSGDKISLIKIDIEGYEYEMLKGAKQTLLKYSPTIFIEIWGKSNFFKEENENFKKVNELLESYNYHIIERLSGANYIYKKLLNKVENEKLLVI
jgi:FkbM family methyltransferase